MLERRGEIPLKTGRLMSRTGEVCDHELRRNDSMNGIRMGIRSFVWISEFRRGIGSPGQKTVHFRVPCNSYCCSTHGDCEEI